MCIVEALRVVENAEAVKCGKMPQPCLPWGKLDNFLARYHATKGKLPAPPASCSDDEWEIIKQMCAFDPEERIKISTVVDKLAQMASGQHQNLKGNLEAEQGTPKVPREAITAARKLLSQLTDDVDRPKSLYTSLWDRLEQVHGTIDDKHESECRAAFNSLVADADEATRMLQDVNESLISLAETTMWYYALNRRLDKFCDAYSDQLMQNTERAEPSESFLARWSRVFWNP